MQKKFKELNITQSDTFDKFRKEEENLRKGKGKLDKVMGQIDVIFSLYFDVLSCRSPTTNYVLFLLERYLLLKIKAIKASKSVELRTTDQFVKCCKEHGIKFHVISVNFI